MKHRNGEKRVKTYSPLHGVHDESARAANPDAAEEY